MRPLITATLLLLVTRLAAWTAEADLNLNIGGTKILVPCPEGFVEVGPAKRVFPSEAPNNLLGWFIRTNDQSGFEAGTIDVLRRYMQIQISKDAVYHQITPTEFSEVATAVSGQQDEIYRSAMTDVNKLLKKMASDNPDLSGLRIDQPKALGTFLKTNNAVGFLMLMTLTVPGGDTPKQVPMLAATTLLRVREKLLFQYVYAAADDKKAVDWVKETSRTWARAIEKAN